MRNLNDAEWLDFKGYVKCNFKDCAHGMGLAGHGVCSAAGEWNRPDCPEFITDDDFIADWKKRDENETTA
jgi:hypothetical protein